LSGGNAEEPERKPNFRIYFSVSGCVKEVAGVSERRFRRPIKFKLTKINLDVRKAKKRFDLYEDNGCGAHCLFGNRRCNGRCVAA